MGSERARIQGVASLSVVEHFLITGTGCVSPGGRNYIYWVYYLSQNCTWLHYVAICAVEAMCLQGASDLRQPYWAFEMFGRHSGSGLLMMPMSISMPERGFKLGCPEPQPVSTAPHCFSHDHVHEPMYLKTRILCVALAHELPKPQSELFSRLRANQHVALCL